MRIALLSNINLPFLIDRLATHFELYYPPGYNTWKSEILHETSGLVSFQPEVVLFFLDGTNLWEETESIEEIDSYSLIQEYAKKNPHVSIILNSLDVIDRVPRQLCNPSKPREFEIQWNTRLNQNTNHRFISFDFKELVCNYGRDRIYSSTGWYLGNIRFSNKGTEILFTNFKHILKSIQGQRKKCLVLDLDNTLWGGVIGEDGLKGISLSPSKEGSQYYQFQHIIKKLKHLGILLTICSKNNIDDVMEVFDHHPHMLLQPKDFVTMKINWDSKVENVKRIASELNIGLNSLVFIDDSPFERNLVKSQLPEVNVPDMPNDSTKLPDWFFCIQHEYFLTVALTDEDQKKTEMYHSQIDREKHKVSTNQLEEYLLSLDMILHIRLAEENDIKRIVQLIQKTNQFNVTTKRYSELEVKNLLESDCHQVYIASLKDRFGDNGNIALLIVKKEANTAEIDTFLMSCRVMGRLIENHILSTVEQKLHDTGTEIVYAKYIPTHQNKPVETLWDSFDYTMDNVLQDGTKQYSLFLKNSKKRQYYSRGTKLCY